MRILVPEQPEFPSRAGARNRLYAFVRRRLCGVRPLFALSSASAAIFALQFVFAFTLAAQTPTTPATTPAQTPVNPPVHHHKKPSATKSAAQSAPAPAPVAQAAPVPCPDGTPAPALSPAAPCIPNWPANNKPAEASVVWDSHGLFIQASNSSLDQILNDISLKTGAKVEGMGADERVFGTYGPGPVRDVLSELLDGSGYNILLVGDLGQGTPRRVVLSGRPAGPAPHGVQQPATDNETEQEQMAQPEAPPAGPGQGPGTGPEPAPVPARFHEPLMQQRPEQMQPQQQQNNPQNPQ